MLVEGAGSPAEINLPDLVNNRVLHHSGAAALLVADIDRGGAFAHLVGTWMLVPETTRERLAGFVLNKFRGDPALLEPGPGLVTERTGMRNAGVLPLLDHRLPDEEGATVRAAPPPGAATVAIVRYPYASNLDEWHLLPHAAHVRWASTPADLDGADLVVLPGSKHVAADAAWLRARGLDAAVAAAARRGAGVLGVCGGAMLLGGPVADPGGVEGSTTGLGLLPLTTEMAATKTTRRSSVTFPALPAPWDGLDGLTVDGYEIRHGEIDGSGVAAGPCLWSRGLGPGDHRPRPVRGPGGRRRRGRGAARSGAGADVRPPGRRRRRAPRHRTAAGPRRGAVTGAPVALGWLGDRLLGEPPAAAHPVAWFGSAMSALERLTYRPDRRAGALHVAAGTAAAALIGASAERVLGRAVAVTAATTVSVAGRMLAVEATAVLDAVEAGRPGDGAEPGGQPRRAVAGRPGR